MSKSKQELISKNKDQREVMTIRDIEQELGVSRKVATAFAISYLHYKKIGRRYLFSRKEFTKIIDATENIVFELNY